MGEVIELKRKKRFTLQEAKQLLPIVKKITQAAAEEVNQLREESDEENFVRLVNRWSEKIYKLGCEPKGLWLVDFDNGQGYYCWHYPEDEVGFFHNYEQGFQNRTPIL